MTIHAVHGWKTDETIISQLCESFTYDFKAFAYNSRKGIYTAQFNNRKYAMQLANKVKHGDDCIAHSNGCPLALRALKDGAPFRRIVLLNPALDNDWPLPPTEKCPELEAVYVLYSKYDIAVKAAKWLMFNQWGDMGAKGPKWPDVRYYGIDAAAIGKAAGLKKKELRHSSIPKNPAFWGEPIDRLFTTSDPTLAVSEFQGAVK